MDTDGFIYEIKVEDPYINIIKKYSEKFDTSDYLHDNRFGIQPKNEQIIGIMKDEVKSKIINEFAGLRSKMYSLRLNNVKFIKKIKGIKLSVVEKTIDFEDYLDCLFFDTPQYRNQRLFRSKRHNIQTIEQRKLALSPYDNKRFLIYDSTDTLPHGHYKIHEIENNMDVDE